MDRLAALRAFVQVVESGGFTQAANRLGQSKSVVSRQVGLLEAELGARLLNRTTRKLTPTDVGRAYFARLQPLLAELDEAADEARQAQTMPRGRLRVTAPVSFGALHLAPALPAFMERYPEVEIDLSLADRFVNLIEDGFDMAVRIGRLADSSLIARKLAPIRRVICASPAYLAAHPAPRIPADLADHWCLNHFALEGEWRLRDPDGGEKIIRGPSRFRTDSGEVLRIMALAGHGMIALPTFFVGDDLKAGRLVSVLVGFVPQHSAVHAVYPSGRHPPARLRAFLDFLSEIYGPVPPWDR